MNDILKIYQVQLVAFSAMWLILPRFSAILIALMVLTTIIGAVKRKLHRLFLLNQLRLDNWTDEFPKLDALETLWVSAGVSTTGTAHWRLVSHRDN